MNVIVQGTLAIMSTCWTMAVMTACPLASRIEWNMCLLFANWSLDLFRNILLTKEESQPRGIICKMSHCMLLHSKKLEVNENVNLILTENICNLLISVLILKKKVHINLVIFSVGKEKMDWNTVEPCLTNTVVRRTPHLKGRFWLVPKIFAV